jgi:hypothetical protein
MTVTLSGVSISSNNSNTSYAKVGDTITVEFTASGALKGDPVVTFKSNGGDVTNSVTVTNTSGTTYEAEYINDTDDLEGDVTFKITYRYRDGNNVLSGTVTTTNNESSVYFDNTIPTLSSVSILSNNSNITSYANLDDEVTLTFSASEEISTPTIVFKSGGDAINNTTITYTNTSDNTWTATYTVAAGDTDGTVGYTIDFKDAGDNSGTTVTTVTDSTTVTVDKTAPTLSPVSITSSNSNTEFAIPGNTVTLTFTANEEIDTPTVTFTSNSVANTNSVTVTNTIDYTWTAEYVVDSNDSAGSVGFSIDYTDLAGNSATTSTTTTDSTTVAIDTTLPTLINVTIESNNSTNTSYATLGNTVTLEFTVDNSVTIDDPPTVLFYHSGLEVENASITYTNTSGTTWTASYDINSLDAMQGGLVTFSIDYEDEYGLSGDQVIAVSDATSVTVDIWDPYIQSISIYTDNTNNTYIATEDDSLVLTFEIVDETDVTTPDVSFNINGSEYSATVELSSTVDISSNEHTASIYTYTATYLIDSSILDGDVSYIIGDYTDAAGNGGTGITQYGSGVYVDKELPELTSVYLTHDNTDISTQYVKADDTILLYITGNESITAPTVVFLSGGQDITNEVTVSPNTTSNTLDTRWTASYVVSSDDTSGEISYTINSYTDSAGQEGDEVTQDSSMAKGSDLEVDVNIPTLSLVSIISSNSTNTLATADDLVTLTFTASKTINSPTVVFTSGGDAINNSTITPSNVSDDNWSVPYTVSSLDTSGDVSFTIDYIDSAGNSGTTVSAVTDGTSVAVDNVAPSLSDVSISSDNAYDTNKATTDDTVTLTFTASEEITTPSVVFTSGGDAINNTIITYTNTSDNTWTASYVVNENDSNGQVSYNATITDLAGNTYTETMDDDAGTMSIDVTAPEILSTSTGYYSISAPDNGNGGFYNADNVITIGVTFDKTVQIIGSGTPFINLNSGGTAIYDATKNDIDTNTTTDTIYFNYTVETGENSSPLNVSSSTPFNISSCSIIDSIGNVAVLTLSNIHTVLKFNDITIDTTAPNDPTEWSITSTRTGSGIDDYYQYATTGNTVSVTLQFDEAVTIESTTFTSGNISVNNDSSGDDLNTSNITHTVSYEVDSGDTEGVVGFSITYADEAGNTKTIDNANIIAPDVETSTTFETITIDLTIPTITETTFESITGTTVVTTGDTIRLEFVSDDSIAFSAYSSGIPTVTFYGLDSDNNHIATVTPTQATDEYNGVTPNNTTTWAYEGVVPDNEDITEMSYYIEEGIDRAGNVGSLEDTTVFIKVDEVPPTIESTSIVSNNVNRTDYAKSGDVITLTINPSETLTQTTAYFIVGTTATASNSDTTSSLYSKESTTDTWYATYTIDDAIDGDGTLYYTITDYTDTADNYGTDDFTQDTDGGTGIINVLTSTPTLSKVSIKSYNANTTLYAKSGDSVTVYFSGARTLNSATVAFLGTESVTAITSTDVDYEWEATYIVSSTNDDGLITFVINFTDLAGNPGTSSATKDSTSVTIDNTAPTINAITTDALSWGGYLNIEESSSDGTVSVTTSGVEDDQTLTLTLNGESYTGIVSSDACTVTITSAGLQGLTDGNIYYISADVTDLVGNAATTVNSSYFTVDFTKPTIVNIKGISDPTSYNADDIVTIALLFSETVYVTGSPSLNLNSDTNASAIYDSGSGSTLLLFKYTVTSGDNTISSNTIGYLDVDSINYDSENYIEDVANNEVYNDYAIPFTSGTQHALSYNTEIVIDTTAPSDFQVGTVEAKGGIYVAGYYNSSNTSVNIHVPIEDDVSLIDGTIRLIFSTNNESTYDTTSFSSYAYTILNGILGNVYTFSVNEIDFESTIGETAEIHFSAIITDKAGNQTTGSASLDTIIRDDNPPHPVTVGDIISEGGRVIEKYYNSTNDGLTISVPINNNPLLVRPDDATTLIAGTVQVLVSVDNGESYNEIGNLVEIESTDLLTNKEIEITDQEFIGAVAEGETALFNVTITDKADNITSSSPAPPDVTVSPAPDHTSFDPYANSSSNGFIRQETLPSLPNVSFTTGSTKSNYNNRISVKFATTIVKWDYTTNFGATYTTIYNNNGAFINLDKGIYLPGSIIIRNYDIADNRSFVSNIKKIIIASSRQGFPLTSQSSTGGMNKTKGFAFSRAANKC